MGGVSAYWRDAWRRIHRPRAFVGDGADKIRERGVRAEIVRNGRIGGGRSAGSEVGGCALSSRGEDEEQQGSDGGQQKAVREEAVRGEAVAVRVEAAIPVKKGPA